MPIRISIVEENPYIRKSIAAQLNVFSDLKCENLFSNAEDFEAALATLEVDVVLIDINLPKKNGIDCIRHCKTVKNINYIIFTTQSEAKDVFDSFSIGATGFLLKSCPLERLAEAIREVHIGGSPMSPEVSRLVTNYFHRTIDKFPTLEKLTKQEKLVLKGLEKGWTYHEIALANNVTTNTVRSQIRCIYKKLEVKTRREALIKVFGFKNII
jgi:DNA-binding NarL/FixJ family response regulator